MTKLRKISQITIHPRSPFHFDGTFHKPSHFPNRLQLDAWQTGTYWQALRLQSGMYGIRVDDIGSFRKPALRVKVFSKSKATPKVLEELKRELSWRFGFDEDLNDFIKLTKQDKRFSPVFRKWLGMRNMSQFDLYGLLIIGVVLQNATVRRSAQMLDALLEKFGNKVQFDHKILYHIWKPEALECVSEKQLRKLRIGYRAKFLKRLSRDFVKGKVDEQQLRILDKEVAKQALMQLYGVGPETVRILLFESCRQYDTFDHIAPWQQKIYSRMFYNESLVSADKIRRDICQQYGTYSMLAVHYIWEDLFWRRKHEHISWLEKEIRL